MEIDRKQLKEVLLWLWTMVETAQREWIARDVALTFLKSAGLAEGFDQLLQQALQHPSPQLLANQRAVRDTIDKLLGEEKPDKLLAFLKNWKPEGPVH